MPGLAPAGDIMSRVAAITGPDSILMRSAAAKGSAAANRRGLINSSIGIGAAQHAVLDTAVPIASQESAQASQEGMAAADLTGRKDMNQAQITSNEGINRANLAAAERERQLSAQVQTSGNYSQSLANTLNNENIPASARADVQAALLRQYNDSLAYAQKLYGVPAASTQTTPNPDPSMVLPDGGIGAPGGYNMRDYLAQQYGAY